MKPSAVVRLTVSSRSGLPLLGLALVGVLVLCHSLVRTEEVLHLEIGQTNANVVLTWTNSGATLESALVVTGLWTELTGAISGHVVPHSNPATFFRLRAAGQPTGFEHRYVAPTFTTSIGDPFGCGCTSPENPNSLATSGGGQDNGMGSVLLHTGELTQEAVDLAIPGRGFDWRFVRVYRSGMTYDGPMGQGWDFNHNRRLVVETNGHVLCVNGLGRVDRYSLNTNGTFSAPGGIYARLTRNLDGTFEERDRHCTTNSYTATNMLGVARLTRTSDRNGNHMAFHYNAAGQLSNVVDTLARSITYRYDANGRLTNVMDFAGRSVRFTYDANGNLVTATSPAVIGTPNGNDFPSGKTTAYTYASGFGDARFNHNLLSVTAPNEVAVAGPARLVAQYDTSPVSTNADRLVSLRLGGTNSTGIGAGGNIYYAYVSSGPVGSNDYATAIFQNTVTNRNGNVNQYRFNQLGNIVRSITFTKGLRPGEPIGFTNIFAYNGDGEMIARTNAELDSTEYTYDSGNPDRLSRGNLLQIKRLPGPRGGDQAQIDTSFTYEPNFNFVVTNIDARGNVTRHTYDARGNRTKTVHRIPSIVEDFEYNAFGQMTAHILPDNGSGHRRRDVMTHYSSGPENGYLQSRIVDAGPTNFNLTTTYEYDAVGNVVRMVDPRGNDTLFTVNKLNQIVRRSSPEVLPGIRYEQLTWYDANDNVVRSDVQNRDETGTLQGNTDFTSISEFDILNHRTRFVQEKGSANLENSVVAYTNISVGLQQQFLTTEFQYDADGNLGLTRQGEATAGNDLFNTVQELWDERDLLFRQVRAPGSAFQSTTQSDYDRNGNRLRTLRVIELAPRTTTYTYDGYDRLVRTLDPMGNTRSNRYDANDNVTTNRVDGELVDVPGSAGNTNLSQTTFTYDAMDRRIRTDAAFFNTQTQTPIDDGLATTRFFYSENSHLVATVDDNTNQTSYAYDTANRLLTTTDALSNTVTHLYDPNSNLQQKTELDRSDIPGQTNETFTTQYTYDSLDRLIRTTDNAGITNQLSYDSRNNLHLLTDGRGNHTLYSYDGLNRRIETGYVLTDNGNGSGTVIGTLINKQSWDDTSRRIDSTDGNTNITQYAYDSLDRRVRTIHADGTTNSTTYNLYDDRIIVTDPNGSSVFAAYDLLGRVITNQVVPGPGVLGTTSENYSYDGLSRVVVAANNDSYVAYSYDSLSQQIGELRVFFSPISGYVNLTVKYDGVGNLIQAGFPKALVQTFDALNRLKVSRFTSPGPGATNAVFQYIGPSRIARIEYGNGVRMDAAYDVDGRVRKIQHYASPPFYDRELVWDAAHNLLSSSNAVGSDLRTYQYDSSDRLVRTDDSLVGSPTLYGLDAVGNRSNVNQGPGIGTYFMDPSIPPGDLQMNQYTIGPSNASRAYDANGNLTHFNGHVLSYDFRNQLVQVDGGQIVSKYDCFGLRIEKSVYGKTNWFIHNAGVEMQEVYFPPFGIGDPMVASYVWGSGELLQMTGTNGSSYFYHADHLGSPIALTGTNASVVESYAYDDFGTPSPASSSVGNPFLYRGNRYDPETELYLLARGFLDPKAGRFISREVVSDCSLGNFFTFALNNPVSTVPALFQDEPSNESPGGKTCGNYWLEQGRKPKPKPLIYAATWRPPPPVGTELAPLDLISSPPGAPPASPPALPLPSIGFPPGEPPALPTPVVPAAACCGKPEVFFKVNVLHEGERGWSSDPDKDIEKWLDPGQSISVGVGDLVKVKIMKHCGPCEKGPCEPDTPSWDVTGIVHGNPSAGAGTDIGTPGDPDEHSLYMPSSGSMDVRVGVTCRRKECAPSSAAFGLSVHWKWSR